MKILVIDPRCVDSSSLYFYTVGLVSGLCLHADVTLVSAYDCNIPEDINCNHKNWFYRRTGRWRNIKVARIVKGVEYCCTYLKIILFTRKKHFDVIHVEWPIIYQFDKFIFRLLKRNCEIFSVKAHNVLPHSSGMKYKNVFSKIYASADIIEVHGLNMKKMMEKIFPHTCGKVIIQYHGTFNKQNILYDQTEISRELVRLIDNYNRVYLFIGRIDNDKGVDRLVRCWREMSYSESSLLIIAGKKCNELNDFDLVEDEMRICKHLLYLPGLVEDNLFNYLVSRADLLVLPYKKGSMSGVAFTAAAFSKPLLATRFGVIEEYVKDESLGFIIENSADALKKAIKYIDKEISNEELKLMGRKIKKYFDDNFSWNKIAEQLFFEFNRRL